MIKARKDL